MLKVPRGYGNGRTFLRWIFAAGAVFFGFFAFFFTKTPEMWSQTKNSQYNNLPNNLSTDFFGPDMAQADVGGPGPGRTC